MMSIKSFEEVKRMLRENEQNLLGRSEEQLQVYFDWKKIVCSRYKSPSEYLKHKIYGWPVEKCTETSLLAAISQPVPDGLHVILRLNDFPYNFHDNCIHYCLWSEREIAAHIIDRYLEVSFPSHEYVWFRNAPHMQSIKDLWHIHVVVKISNFTSLPSPSVSHSKSSAAPSAS